MYIIHEMHVSMYMPCYILVFVLTTWWIYTSRIYKHT